MQTQGVIRFEFVENINHPFPDEETLYRKWLFKCADSEAVEIKKITYIFCSDDYLLDINIRHLDHNYYTDIITFPYKEGNVIHADIFISVDRVKENAEEFDVTFHHELRRVMVHGLLHLIGYKDKTDAESAMMRRKEDEYVQLLV